MILPKKFICLNYSKVTQKSFENLKFLLQIFRVKVTFFVFLKFNFFKLDLFKLFFVNFLLEPKSFGFGISPAFLAFPKFFHLFAYLNDVLFMIWRVKV
jgi:hypothetical protein